MIVTLTVNPAVDKTTHIDRLIPEKKLRCAPLTEEAGGGGINVSKALQELGAAHRALFLSGGDNGRLLERLLERKGIPYAAVPTAAETRESFTVSETGTGAQYRFILPGATPPPVELEALLDALAAASPSLVVASGSLPPGVPDDWYGQLAHRCRKEGIRLIVDTSGVPLQRALEAGVFLVKPNLSELCSLVGTDHLELHQVNEAARSVIDRGGCEAMVVSMGPSGALALSADGEWRIPAPVVKKLSTVGAGDSMIAGICHQLQQGRSLAEAARFGVACGTAATMNPGSQLFRRQDAERLHAWIESQPQ